VTIKKVFFDANIFNDIFDTYRPAHKVSNEAYLGALRKGMVLYTSCDIATNIYYITAKYTSRENALDALDFLKTSVSIIPFADPELTKAIALMRKDSDYIDFEDTIQYILALESKCDVIVTNDKKFMAKELTVLTSKAFVEKFL
jgi:predicted nucleic acid-binding protein